MFTFRVSSRLAALTALRRLLELHVGLDLMTFSQAVGRPRRPNIFVLRLRRQWKGTPRENDGKRSRTPRILHTTRTDPKTSNRTFKDHESRSSSRSFLRPHRRPAPSSHWSAPEAVVSLESGLRPRRTSCCTALPRSRLLLWKPESIESSRPVH